MAAKEAKQISDESAKVMEEITKAAFDGKTEITVSSLSTIINQGLIKLGYNVKSFNGGPNEINYKISW